MNKFSVAIDIGGTNTELAIVDDLGNVICHNSFQTTHNDTFNGYIQAIAS